MPLVDLGIVQGWCLRVHLVAQTAHLTQHNFCCVEVNASCARVL